MSQQFQVVGLGNALMDVLVRLQDDSILSAQSLDKGIMHPVDDKRWKEVYSMVETLPVERSLQTGGSCANTIATLGLMGAKVSYCGQVGDDSFGQEYTRQMLSACGHQSVVVGAGATGKCLSLVSADAERTMLTDLGAAVGMAGLGSFAQAIEQADVLHLTGYLLLGDPMKSRLFDAVEIAKAAGVKISLDVADPWVVSATAEVMKPLIEAHVDIVFLNAEEAVAMSGSTPEAAIEQLRSSCETVVVKLGKEGSMIAHAGELVRAQAELVDAIDTTGAGDSYAAGFLYGLVSGWSMAASARLGSHVAAQTVSQLGAVVRDRDTLAACITAAE